MIDIKGKYTTAKVYTDELEKSASEEILDYIIPFHNMKASG